MVGLGRVGVELAAVTNMYQREFLQSTPIFDPCDRDGNKSPQGGDGKDRAPPDGITADPATARAVHVGDEMEFNMDALDLSDMKVWGL